MKTGAGRKRLVNGYVVVAEDEMVNIVVSGVFKDEFIQRLILATENISGIMAEAVASRPPVPEAECNPRMKETEQELSHSVMEKSPEETVAERNGTEAVTMSQTEDFPAYGHKTRLLKANHSQFFKI